MKIELPELDILCKQMSQLTADMSQLKESNGIINSYDRLVRTTEAGKILGVSASTIRGYVKQGLLKQYHTVDGGGQAKFWVSDLHKLVTADDG